MKGLQTARVVVVDDVADEAWPIIRALGRIGVGALYVSGDRVEDLPSQPLSGIRLAFVDMKLNVEGTDRQVVSKTVGVLETILGRDCSPCLVVTWTKHPSLVAEFRRAIAARMESLRPGLVLQLEKPNNPDGADTQEIVDSITEMMKNHWASHLLWDWEGLAHRASTATTALVAAVAVGEESKGGQRGPTVRSWERAVRAALGALMRAEGGKLKYDDEQHTLNLLRVLSALHLDCLEQSASEWKEANVDRCTRAGGETLSPAGRNALNTRLIVSQQVSETRDTSPGNIYVLRSTKGVKCPVYRFRITQAVFTDEREPDWKSDEELKRLNRSASNSAAQLEKLQKNQRATRERLRQLEAEIRALERSRTSRQQAILRSCHPALVDVTAPCDHVQGKRRVARFAAGLLVPDEHRKLFALRPEDRAFLRILPGFECRTLVGCWTLVVNARHSYSLATPRRLINSAPLCRLRAPVLSDLQAWLASHASRPGFAALD